MILPSYLRNGNDEDDESFFHIHNTHSRHYHHHQRDDASLVGADEEPTTTRQTTTTTITSSSSSSPRKHWCFTGLAMALWLTILMQLFVLLWTLIRQNVACGWDHHPSQQQQQTDSFCFPVRHPVMEALVLALYLFVLWLAMFLTYLLVAWLGQVCCDPPLSSASWQPVDEAQQYPPIYYTHNNTVTTLSYYWDNNHHNNRSHHYYGQSPPTVASSSWDENSDQDSDEMTPLVVYVV